MPEAYSAFTRGKLLINEGMLFENVTAQLLRSSGKELHYVEFQAKENDKNVHEIVFILPRGKNILPVEVKSGDRTTSKSLAKFRKTYSPRSSIRLSSKNFGREDDLYSIPLYAAFCIDKGWADKVGEDRTE